MRAKILYILICSFIALGGGAQNPLIIPDTISGVDFNLNLQKGEFRFFEERKTETMGVNGNILGPTLLMQRNDFVNIRVKNQLNESTTIHWHGMHVSAANDGGPHNVIQPGESWNPKFKVLDKAGTYWYHPHLHESTNKHVSLGIAGFILVKDEKETAINLPRIYGVDDFPLVIQTKDFDSNKQIIVESNNDDILMVNATINPFLEVPAQVVRFRLLNGSSQRTFNLGLSNNSTFYQIATDGGLVEKPNPLSRLKLSPGERAEILIDFSELENQTLNLKSFASELPNGIYGAASPGIGFMMQLNGYNPNPLNGTDFEVLEFRIQERLANPVLDVPEKLLEQNKPDENRVNQVRSLSFNPAQMGPNQLNGNFLINGMKYNMDVINFSIPLNNIEIWELSNFSGIAHPFHIHDVQFYILDRNGNPPPLHEKGSKDVVLVHPMETVRFITQFTDFANDSVPYMLHCHMLPHEDNGMMLQFEVVDKATKNTVFQEIKTLVYPNPAKNKINVLGDFEGRGQLTFFDLNGNVVQQKSILGHLMVSLNLSKIPAGQYVLEIQNNNKVSREKVIVQR